MNDSKPVGLGGHIHGIEIRAIFFDLDGTLLDSEVLYVDAVQLALARDGWWLSPSACQDLVYGRGWTDIFNDVRRMFPRAYERMEDMEIAVRKVFLELQRSRDIAIKSSVDLLRRLAEKYPVAVISGSPREDVIRGIDELGIDDLLQFFLGSEDYYPGKPDPICYLTAAARMGVLPETCLVFEDSAAGVTAAKAASMFCVGLQRPQRPEQDLHLADAVYADLGEFDIVEFFRGLAERRTG
ncbi:MAG: HAD family phosphatase [Acidobacteriota bacterium]|jgi:beta-phosphoglucomutase